MFNVNEFVLAAANSVRAAATPKRNVTLRDEFGPIRGRRVLERAVDVLDIDVDELGRSHHRSAVAYALAG